MKGVVLIGATGSIGSNTVEVLRRHPGKLRLVGVAAGQNRERLDAIAREFGTQHTSLFREEGVDGLVRLATLDEADIVLLAATGTVGLRPALAALEAGKTLALASKEVLVLAGGLVMETARRHGARILPVDSEHNAIFQCLHGRPADASVRRLVLTASGGTFRDLPPEALAHVTPEDATRHPNWDMGPKITVDSATMANKGLELIEAHWLFGLPPEQLDVVLHPQSLVHSMVEFIDGSILAQLSPPSMTFAIQYALLHPKRADGTAERLDLTRALQLDFAPVDTTRYPCLRLARNAMETGGGAPAVFNAANEIAVNRFLENRLPFVAIPEVIAHCLESLSPPAHDSSLEELLATEENARTVAGRFADSRARG
ncbi:MAG: 1-deoxy-D-xylulose-5-phosphate reductoisomerase [Opitutales bacterium]|nr:1-deoxy-D-xylulose-5-phosphate reductoisomerase [Opitutales bacterium]